MSRSHATLKQRQKDSGVTVRARYKKKRSSSESAASQVARLRRQARYEEVVELYRQGKSIAAEASLLQMSPTTVRTFIYAGAFPERSAHRSRRLVRLEPYQPYLEQRVQQGCDNASLRLRRRFASKALRMDIRWSTRGYESTWTSQDATRREQEKAKRQTFFDAVQAEQGMAFSPEERVPETTTQGEYTPPAVEPLDSPRHLTWLLLRSPESLDPHEQQVLTFIREVEAINTTYDLVQRFLTMVRQRHAEQLDTWLEDCLVSTIPDLQTFAEGLKREYTALKAALTYSYSNDRVA